jgi:hypothetical protein
MTGMLKPKNGLNVKNKPRNILNFQLIRSLDLSIIFQASGIFKVDGIANCGTCSLTTQMIYHIRD